MAKYVFAFVIKIFLHEALKKYNSSIIASYLLLAVLFFLLFRF